MRILGIPLGWILHFCYSLVQNYGLALVMFTVLARLILLPLSIKQQKGMVKMAMFRPKMEEIQKKYAKNPHVGLSAHPDPVPHSLWSDRCYL